MYLGHVGISIRRDKVLVLPETITKKEFLYLEHRVAG